MRGSRLTFALGQGEFLDRTFRGLDGADTRRTDKKQPFADKVKKVEEILAKETQG